MRVIQARVCSFYIKISGGGIKDLGSSERYTYEESGGKVEDN